MTRVSVIIPVFNAEETIIATLQSVLNQTYRDWEIIVADDGSTDASAALARSLSPRIRVLASPINRGPAAARNLAIAHAAGELLAFLDSDDIWLPRYMESQVRAHEIGMNRYGNVGAVACDAYLEDATGARLSTTYRDYVPFPRELTIEALLEANPVFVSALTPTRIVRELGGFDVRTFGSEDHDLWLKMVERGYRVIYNPEPLVIYRLRDASVSSRRAAMARTNQATYRLVLERGNLSARQRHLARRSLRLQVAVEAVEEYLSSERQDLSLRATARFGAGLAVFALHAVTHPRRWRGWLGATFRGRAGWRAQLR